MALNAISQDQWEHAVVPGASMKASCTFQYDGQKACSSTRQVSMREPSNPMERFALAYQVLWSDKFESIIPRVECKPSDLSSLDVKSDAYMPGLFFCISMLDPLADPDFVAPIP